LQLECVFETIGEMSGRVLIRVLLMMAWAVWVGCSADDAGDDGGHEVFCPVDPCRVVAPPRGQRTIVFDGRSGKAVVAAAGYENGPGDLARIGGACEEIHHYHGTGHLSVMTFGVAADQELPFGPIVCQE
jgi:hypothetical protein